MRARWLWRLGLPGMWPRTTILADSSSLEVAAGDGGAEATSDQTVLHEVVTPDPSSQLPVALAGAAPAVIGGPTLT